MAARAVRPPWSFFGVLFNAKRPKMANNSLKPQNGPEIGISSPNFLSFFLSKKVKDNSREKFTEYEKYADMHES